MKREEIEKVYDQGKEAVVNLVEGLIKEFTDQIATLTNRTVITAVNLPQVMD